MTAPSTQRAILVTLPGVRRPGRILIGEREMTDETVAAARGRPRVLLRRGRILEGITLGWNVRRDRRPDHRGDPGPVGRPRRASAWTP